MIFEPEKIAPHGSLGGCIPRIGFYKGNLRALGALVASESPQLTFKCTYFGVLKDLPCIYIHIYFLKKI
jgi:hypothetical protein